MTDPVNLTPYSRSLRPSFFKQRVRLTRLLGLAEVFETSRTRTHRLATSDAQIGLDNATKGHLCDSHHWTEQS